jgi:hypothetical protein
MHALRQRLTYDKYGNAIRLFSQNIDATYVQVVMPRDICG